MTDHSRYIIGVDLGTTNSAVAYIDTQDSNLSIRSLPIKQVCACGTVEERTQLPSFCYLFGDDQAPPLPWQKSSRNFVVGEYAYSCGGKTPTRFVHSAKSWLCHSAAERRGKILPREAFDESGRISPVEATARFLNHIKEAWDATIAAGDVASEFDQQDVVLTVPASFDEVARTLTAEAAKEAGFSNMTLLEEPQSAFYHWIADNEKLGCQAFADGETILVCDVGGGTTDFSLIAVKEGGFERIATGKHLLLGGNNMDVALAFMAEEKMRQEETLSSRKELNDDQWSRLSHAVCSVKEELLSANGEKSATVTLHGSGRSVVGGSLSCSLGAQEVKERLCQGFFGICSYKEALDVRKTGGIKMMGLPFEDEPSILKHMALFLHNAGDISPDHVLFNGGTMAPKLFQDAVTGALNSWFPEKKVNPLASRSLHLAVSRGAAYYGKVRRGLGVKISSGTMRTLYVGVDVDKDHKALVLLPRGSQEGASFQPQQSFSVRPNQPVSFQLFGSQTRLEDKSGEVVTVDEELQPLPPIHTMLRFGKRESCDAIAATLEATLTPVGTVELWLKALKSDHRWRLEFQLRSSSGHEDALAFVAKGRQDETFDATYTEQASKVIRDLFENKSIKPKELMNALEDALQQPRLKWPPSVLRTLWDDIIACAPKGFVAPELESRWWNIAGFVLRPGFGYPLDDHRIKALWKILLAKGQKSSDVLVQQWIAYRRIAGGLKRGQQTAMAAEMMKTLFDKRGKITFKNSQEAYLYTEKIRALAAMEHLDISVKKRLGEALVERIVAGDGSDAEFWALGRIGARQLLYGSLTHVVPKEVCVGWIDRLIDLKDDRLPTLFAQLARKTDQREINIPRDVIDRIEGRLGGCDRLKELLEVAQELTVEEQGALLGDELPNGLVLASPS